MERPGRMDSFQVSYGQASLGRRGERLFRLLKELQMLHKLLIGEEE